jgi:hypothetical protein
MLFLKLTMFNEKLINLFAMFLNFRIKNKLIKIFFELFKLLILLL